MKPAICSRCKKDLHHKVPDDATEIVCFECDNRADNARKDLSRYTTYLAQGRDADCVRIEEKYGLLGATPQHVSEVLADIAAGVLVSTGELS